MTMKPEVWWKFVQSLNLERTRIGVRWGDRDMDKSIWKHAEAILECMNHNIYMCIT